MRHSVNTPLFTISTTTFDFKTFKALCIIIDRKTDRQIDRDKQTDRFLYTSTKVVGNEMSAIYVQAI